MTDSTNTADPGTDDTQADGPAGSQPSGDTTAEPDAPGDSQATDTSQAELHAEAKSWRLKYRAAATRADVAEARIAAQNRKHAEQVLAKRLADPSDAFANGLDIDLVLNDDGLVDEEAVLAYADELVRIKPHYAAKLRPLGAPATAVRSDDPIPTPGTGFNWHGIIAGKTG